MLSLRDVCKLLASFENMAGPMEQEGEPKSPAKLKKEFSSLLVKEWFDESDINEFTPGMHRKVLWKCNKCSNKWRAMIYSRNNGVGCPACAGQAVHSDGRNSLRTLRPDLALEWSLDNSIKPEEVTIGSNKKILWKCNKCFNQWKAIINSRSRGCGCPACAGKAVHSDGRNSLKSVFPTIADELIDENVTADLLTSASNKKVLWGCKICKHKWLQSVNNRTRRKSGCPFCSGRVVHVDGHNSMAKTHPQIALELLPNKFGTQYTILAGTNTKLPWKCKICTHEWNTTGAHRIEGNDCPACSGRVVHNDGRNSMAMTHPELAKEFQGNPKLVKAGTGKILDWKCSTCEFEWKTAGAHRTSTNKTGCPSCAKYGFNPNTPAEYYSLKIDGPDSTWWYKGGITNDVEVRIANIKSSLRSQKMDVRVTIIATVSFQTGAEAKEFEQKLLDIESIRANTVETFDGSTELFNVDPIAYAQENQLLGSKKTAQMKISDFL
jgi:Zn finger protein HypA/HybF involved in hydrogenase expression